MAATADPYTILMVDRGADDAQIRSAFRRLIGRWHPDIAPEADAAARAAEIIAAYRTLSHPERRRQHDRRRTVDPIPPGAERRQGERRRPTIAIAGRPHRTAAVRVAIDMGWAAAALTVVCVALTPDLLEWQRAKRTAMLIAQARPAVATR